MIAQARIQEEVSFNPTRHTEWMCILKPKVQELENVIFWGAGATKSLGIRMTDEQTRFIKLLTGFGYKYNLRKRVKDALWSNGSNIGKEWQDALFDLITILGDRDENYDCIDEIDVNELKIMKRNWPGATTEELKSRIISLRLVYDWPALKSLVSICPGVSQDSFKLNDLFNLLDMHIPLGFGVRAPTNNESLDPNKAIPQFFDARRLIGAKNALRLILLASFYIDYQVCIGTNCAMLDKYFEFAIQLGRRMQSQGELLASRNPKGIHRPEFYKADVGIVSLNYDPILLWVQFNANRKLNNASDVPKVRDAPLHLFHDFGHVIPARRIEGDEANWPWYPMNEGATQRLNEQNNSDSRIRLVKFLFPHGCLCWRECPDCRKLSAYHGDRWGLDATGIFPPPPLLAFDTNRIPRQIKGEEREQREAGAVDARACLHCGTLTYAHHTQTVMQSSFKSQPPSFIDEIQRDLRDTAMRAKHIIFMGYSLPPDDVAYRAFFAASRQRIKRKVRCTVVGWVPNYPHWYGPKKLGSLLKKITDDFPREHAVRAAREIFGNGNVRFFGGGVPGVFLDGDKVTEDSLNSLLKWSSKPLGAK